MMGEDSHFEFGGPVLDSSNEKKIRLAGFTLIRKQPSWSKTILITLENSPEENPSIK
ncbi:hypothetical protein [Methanosarcina mazei]|uniref:hypothetical protein n=1 Tax=Methanosarcina mazei TaxID=2209 RepID=UPI0018B05162|nr:hypothetical protein [Methanosarcina mazei]